MHNKLKYTQKNKKNCLHIKQTNEEITDELTEERERENKSPYRFEKY